MTKESLNNWIKEMNLYIQNNEISNEYDFKQINSLQKLIEIRTIQNNDFKEEIKEYKKMIREGFIR